MNVQEHVEMLLADLFVRSRAQFGEAIKGFWFYEPDPCPGCGRVIDKMRYKGQDALSLNAYIYRARGMLIGYFLCGQCAQTIFRAARRQPGKETALHKTIEVNLGQAYERHINSMDA
jgi:hypothetical protein